MISFSLSSVLHFALFRDMLTLRQNNANLFDFAWVNIPLIYTQLVQLIVTSYFFAISIFSNQVSSNQVFHFHYLSLCHL